MNLFAKTLTAIALGSVAVGASADDISANVGLATDYMFRGVSQTDNQMSLLGGFDWAHESGIYVGTWASNVSSDFFAGGADPQLEVDLYGGYRGAMGAFSYDLGVVAYFYPGADFATADDFETYEFYAGGGYALSDALSLNAKLYYADELNFVGVSESGTYLSLSAAYAVMDGFGLSAGIGFSDGDAFDTIGTNNGSGADGYTDYSVGASTSFAGADFSLMYIDSDDDAADLFGDNITDGRAVFKMSKTF